MAYTERDQLQLFCIFMIAIAGIEMVFFSVKMEKAPETIVQLGLIISMFIVVCLGYQSTETRSVSLAMWYYRLLITIGVLQVLEFCTSLYLRFASSRDNGQSLNALIGWEVFNLFAACIGVFLGRRYLHLLQSHLALSTQPLTHTLAPQAKPNSIIQEL